MLLGQSQSPIFQHFDQLIRFLKPNLKGYASVQCSPGNSGGLLVNDNGKAIGIIKGEVENLIAGKEIGLVDV